MNLSMLIINKYMYLELIKILENTNLHEYAFTDMLMEQADELVHELAGVRMAPTSDTISTSALAPCNWKSNVLHSGVDPCLGSSLSSSSYASMTKQHSPTLLPPPT